ncbi:ABC transporter ATP-binding protein [Lysinibacillus sp. NPDC096418]|uniref:ABC transporter ATP-binding protein n=1 Tax=Lysinibacillus sp. NPDC096418 TaxID=3364138 RepID=UPI00380E7E4E
MNKQILKIEQVSKCFKGQVVLQDITFTLEQGTIVGLLGANGAGKSTLMKIISGLLKEESGNVQLLQHAPFSEWHRLFNQVGILLEPAIPNYLTGQEFLKQMAILRGETLVNIAEILKQVGLEQAGKKKVSHYSFGMKQRLGLAAALIGKPKFLMLDEPFVGLDPLGIGQLQNILKSMVSKGTTVLLSSHQLAELEPLVDRILFLSQGKITHDLLATEEIDLQQLFKEDILYAT